MLHPTVLNRHWYDFLEEVANAYYRAMSVVRARRNESTPLAPLLGIRSGYAESPGWFMVQAAEFDPEPLTFQRLRVRHIYGSDRIIKSLLELLASEKWFDRNARDEYALTDAGREMVTRIFARRRGWLEELESGDWEQATAEPAQTLRALIDASMERQPSWCLAHSRRRAHLQEQSPFSSIFQYLEDFNAVRDDAHMAAWQPLGVTGVEWETLAYVAEEQATSPDALFDQLYYRGHTRLEFADTLNALTQRGWLASGKDETWNVTAQGSQVRAEVESKTDEHFFAPWKTLSESTLTRLADQLENLKQILESKSAS